MALILDRRIQFERFSSFDDGLQIIEQWADHGGPISASRQDVSDQEKAVSGWIEATVVARFIVRSSTFTRDLTPRDRLKHGGKTWDIQGIKEAKGPRRAFLEITALGRADV